MADSTATYSLHGSKRLSSFRQDAQIFAECEDRWLHASSRGCWDIETMRLVPLLCINLTCRIARAYPGPRPDHAAP